VTHPTSTIPRVYSAGINYTPDGHCCSVGYGADTWESLLMQTTQTIIDTQAIDPTYHPVVTYATWQCAECYGRGEVRKIKGYGMRRCPVCHGRNSSLDVLPELIGELYAPNNNHRWSAALAEQARKAHESRVFTAAYRHAESIGITDWRAHEWACEHMRDFATVA